MRWEEFDRLVERLEEKSKNSLKGYKIEVLFIAFIGYLYILSVLAITLFITLFIIMNWRRLASGGAVKIIIVLALIDFYIIRSLCVKMTPPKGYDLDKEKARKFLDNAEELKAKLKAPGVNRILLTHEFNASVVTVPRLGIFGWNKYYLCLGMPLLLSLSPGQVRAVLGHELAHLSRLQDSFSLWIYRIRITWDQIYANLGNSLLFKHFLKWYVPLFNAYSFVLMRLFEYEADRLSAQVIGSKEMRDALVNIELMDAHLENNFWKECYNKVNEQEDPPDAVYRWMEEALKSYPQQDRLRQWLNTAVLRKTHTQDPHPSFEERILALNEEPAIPAQAGESAARYYFLADYEAVITQMNRDWQEAVRKQWKERHGLIENSKKDLSALEDKSKGGILDKEELWQLAYYTELIKGEDEGLPLYRKVLELHPTHAAANFTVGRLLLSRDDGDGIGYVNKAIDLDFEFMPEGCSMVYEFLIRHGKNKEAEEYYKSFVKKDDAVDPAIRERSTLSHKDKYAPHGLSDEQVCGISGQISAKFPEIKEVYFVRKELKHFPEKPLYVLGVVVKRNTFKFESQDKDVKLCERLANEVKLPIGVSATFFTVSLTDPEGRPTAIKKAISKIPGAKIS